MSSERSPPPDDMRDACRYESGVFPRPDPPRPLTLTRPDPREDLALDEALLRETNDAAGRAS